MKPYFFSVFLGSLHLVSLVALWRVTRNIFSFCFYFLFFFLIWLDFPLYLPVLSVCCVWRSMEPVRLSHAELTQKMKLASGFRGLVELHHTLKLHQEKQNFLFHQLTLPVFPVPTLYSSVSPCPSLHSFNPSCSPFTRGIMIFAQSSTVPWAEASIAA